MKTHLERFIRFLAAEKGLSAAYQLALRGHAVTLHEAGPALGGVLRNGIPAYRLPPNPSPCSPYLNYYAAWVKTHRKSTSVASPAHARSNSSAPPKPKD